jgi:ribosomal protein L40E
MSARGGDAVTTPKCRGCGSESLAGGAVHGFVRASFRPEGAKFLTLETSDVMTRATMCRECGLIEIVGDVRKLERLTTAAARGEEPQP